MEHLLHHVKTRVPLVVAGDPEAKLLVDVDRCLQVFVLMLAMVEILMVMKMEINMMTLSTKISVIVDCGCL